MKFWTSLTALLPLSHRSNPDQMPHFKKNKQRKKKTPTVYEINWKLVSDGLILISFKSIGVFPAVFSVAGLGWWERGNLSMTLVGFGWGPWWAAATFPDVPGIPARPLQHLQGQPGCSRHSPQAGLQQTSLQGHFGQAQAATWQDNSWSQESTSPGACRQPHPPPTARTALSAPLV